MTVEDKAETEAIRARLEGTNINEQSMLATDFLNHYNEVMMLYEMLPDMPDCLDELKSWKPKSYQAHFRDSGFSDADLAIEAYEHAPDRFRVPFDAVIARLDAALYEGIDSAEKALATNNEDILRETVSSVLPSLRGLQETAGSIINGAVLTLDQSGVDEIFDT